MKIIIVHDKRGSIKSVAVPGAEFSHRIGLKLPRGLHMCQMELPDMNDGNLESVHKIREQYRIRTSGDPALIKSSAAKKK